MAIYIKYYFGFSCDFMIRQNIIMPETSSVKNNCSKTSIIRKSCLTQLPRRRLVEDDIREAVAGGRSHQVGHRPAQRHAQSPRGRAQDGHGCVVPDVCNIVPVDLQATGCSAHWQAHTRSHTEQNLWGVSSRARTVMRRSPALRRPSALAGLSKISCM